MLQAPLKRSRRPSIIKPVIMRLFFLPRDQFWNYESSVPSGGPSSIQSSPWRWRALQAHHLCDLSWRCLWRPLVRLQPVHSHLPGEGCHSFCDACFYVYSHSLSTLVRFSGLVASPDVVLILQALDSCMYGVSARAASWIAAGRLPAAWSVLHSGILRLLHSSRILNDDILPVCP